jgi:hypothetical protein
MIDLDYIHLLDGHYILNEPIEIKYEILEERDEKFSEIHMIKACCTKKEDFCSKGHSYTEAKNFLKERLIQEFKNVKKQRNENIQLSDS